MRRIFKDRLVRDGAGKPLFIAFDVYEKPVEERADADPRRASQPHSRR
ncbi:MAG: hypothetical protein MZV65_29675 [Chromatiales bacterium]|nr:hypothetical protein [Chromatiales bacterium]